MRETCTNQSKQIMVQDIISLLQYAKIRKNEDPIAYFPKMNDSNNYMYVMPNPFFFLLQNFFLRDKAQPLLYTVPLQKSLTEWEDITSTTALCAGHQRRPQIQAQLLSFGK